MREITIELTDASFDALHRRAAIEGVAADALVRRMVANLTLLDDDSPATHLDGDAPTCVYCGYDLTGLPGNRECPECGRLRPAPPAILPCPECGAEFLGRTLCDRCPFALADDAWFGWERSNGRRAVNVKGTRQLRVDARGYATRTGVGPPQWTPWSRRLRVSVAYGRVVRLDQMLGPFPLTARLLFAAGSLQQARAAAERIVVLLRAAT